MPPAPWTGYGRFCPLARGLDVVGDRWTLVIVQELLKRTSRYGELMRRLPGMSTTVLTERLRKLEAGGVVERRPGAVGDGVVYALTQRGLELDEALTALRRWGVVYLTDPAADGAACHSFDVHYVEGIDNLDDAEFGLVVDDKPTTLRFAEGQLEQSPGMPDAPDLLITTTSAFMARWAEGEVTWDEGIAAGDVGCSGPSEAWPRWLAASGFVSSYATECSDA
jgi:DNA-binding HxlR family transcriptional regulator